MRALLVTTSGLLLIAAFSCLSEKVPATPTYEDDVRPILLANCARCHEPPVVDAGAPATGASVPTPFRLDRWESTGTCPPPADAGTGDTACVLGVQDMAERIVVRAADEGTMPPTGPLTDAQREILKRWERAGWP